MKSSQLKPTSRVLDYEAVLMSSSPNVLCLGMVFAHDKNIPKRGQEFRDHIRCQALRNQGYKVYTLDDKHDDSEITEHCRANFADTRRMINSMKSKWSEDEIKFNHIILDYFFSPIGWARERWNERFFYSTLPALAKEGMLAENGTIWLPNLSCITDPIDRHLSTLDPYFDVFFVENPKKNPLYRATELVDKDLLRCPDALTNETQLRPLLAHSSQPFVALVLKKDWEKNLTATPPSTPKKIKRKIEETDSLEDTSGLRRSPRVNKRRALLAF